jgi:two-component system KDP operon response regulator KdpE
MSEPAVVLVIEDDPNARTVLRTTLVKHGYHCVEAPDGVRGVAAVRDHGPQLVLLDLGLPDLDGVEVTRRIREKTAAPIIVVSARDAEEDKIAALDEGANDYVTKPYLTGELLARIRVALRPGQSPANAPAPEHITVGDLSVDLHLKQVRVAGTEVALTPTEYRLLVLMMRSAGRVLTHEHILREVWGPRYTTNMNYLRVYMKKLRYKIEPEPARPKYLLNDPGVGYRLRVAE